MFFLLKLISRSPLWLLYAFASVLSFPLRIFYRRKLVINNLKRAFPEKDSKQLNEIANKFYKRFSEILVETLKSATISEKEIAKRVVFKNPEIFIRHKEAGKSVLIYASHQCNWEWMAMGGRTYFPIPGDPIYKPLQNKKADKFIYDIRSRFGSKPLSKDIAAREILRQKDTFRIIGLVADQSPPRDHVFWTHFFGQETDFYPGLVTLPYLMQAATVFCRIKRIKRGYYEVEVVDIGHPPFEKKDYSVLKNYIEETEKLISQAPENYLWTHNRWKHTRLENEEIINFSEK